MKILAVCQHYTPEPYYLSDVLEELVKRGHEVMLVTGVPNYPMGMIYDGYRKGEKRDEVLNGVKVHRSFTIGRRKNIFFRFLNYYSYSFSSTWYVNHLKEEFDVVFTNQSSPVMMSRAAVSYAKKHHKKSVLYCMDLWPASLSAGGVSEHNPLYRFFAKVSKKIYSRADRILITSSMFRKYFMEKHGIDHERIGDLPQYAPSCFSELPPVKEKSGYDFVFAGNIGAAQSLDTVVEAAKLLDEDVRFHIVGDGSELENLKKKAEGLKNVIFYGRKPQSEMMGFYEMADALLVLLQKDEFISMTLPGKVQTYMAAGRPILAAAEGEIPEVISKAECGFCAPPEDPKAFSDIVREFMATENKNRLGKNARAYYEANFTRDRFMETLEQELQNATV